MEPMTDRMIERMIERMISGLNWTGLRNIQVRGSLPVTGCVWAANHHSWWDGWAGAAAIWHGERRPGLLMDPANLARFGFLRRVGVRGTDELRAATRALADGSVMIVFPEGELRSPGGLGAVHRGAAWLAVRSGTPVVPVATRAALRAHAAPEYLIDIGPPLWGDDVRRLNDEVEWDLSDRLAALDAQIATTDPAEFLPGYREVHRGRRDWDERVSRVAVRP
jgi:1-acyl-sn-glycerol-3-phosphate acyltransferase